MNFLDKVKKAAVEGADRDSKSKSKKEKAAKQTAPAANDELLKTVAERLKEIKQREINR